MTRRPPLADWESKKAAIALSKARRELLREFAQSIDPGMGKAAALYELIDTALPLVKPPPAPTDAEEARAIAERSARALERVAQTLAPFEELISAQGREALDNQATPAPNSFEPADWIAGALRKLGQPPLRALVLMLSWRSITNRGKEGPWIEFTVSRLRLDDRALDASSAALPTLLIKAPAASLLPDISLSRLSRGAALECRPASGGWACELRASDTRDAPPLLCFRC